MLSDIDLGALGLGAIDFGALYFCLEGLVSLGPGSWIPILWGLVP